MPYTLLPNSLKGTRSIPAYTNAYELLAEIEDYLTVGAGSPCSTSRSANAGAVDAWIEFAFTGGSSDRFVILANPTTINDATRTTGTAAMDSTALYVAVGADISGGNPFSEVGTVWPAGGFSKATLLQQLADLTTYTHMSLNYNDEVVSLVLYGPSNTSVLVLGQMHVLPDGNTETAMCVGNDIPLSSTDFWDTTSSADLFPVNPITAEASRTTSPQYLVALPDPKVGIDPTTLPGQLGRVTARYRTDAATVAVGLDGVLFDEVATGESYGSLRQIGSGPDSQGVGILNNESGSKIATYQSLGLSSSRHTLFMTDVEV